MLRYLECAGRFTQNRCYFEAHLTLSVQNRIFNLRTELSVARSRRSNSYFLADLQQVELK
jgi:hypothetical protein